MKSQALRNSYKKSASVMGNSHKQLSKISENYSNQNLFGETDYKMKKDFQFEQEVDEQNCNRNIFFRYLDVLKAGGILINLRNILYIFIEWNEISLIMNIFRIISLLLIIFYLVAISNVNKLGKNTSKIRWFFEFDNVSSIVLYLNRKDITITTFPVLFVKCFYYNLIFNLNLKEAIIYYSIELTTILLFLEKGLPESFTMQFIHNLFSYDGLYLLLITLFICVAQSFMVKANRELWALYDSFKRSYFTLKNISDELPFPIFVVNMKRQTNPSNNTFFNYVYQTYYKNIEAEKILIRLRKIRDKNSSKYLSVKTQKLDSNFKDLFEKSVEKLLDSEIEKTILNGVKYFDFPLIIGDAKLNFKQNPNFPTLYDGELESIKWVRIIINSTSWKGQECLMIQIMEKEEIQHDYFLSQYKSYLNKEFLVAIDNIDAICKTAPEIKSEDEEEEHEKETLSPFLKRDNNRQFNMTGTKTPENLRSPAPNHTTFLRSPLIFAQKSYMSPDEYDSKCIINLKAIGDNYNKLLRLSTNNVNRKPAESNKKPLALNFNLQIKPSSHTVNKFIRIPINKTPKEKHLQFDYSTLFLLKSSINYIYDMYLTINIMNAIKMNKIQTKLTQFYFENLIRYFISYLSPILKLKNIVIDVFSEIDGDINAIYDYYRVIFFNTILFIINNTNPSIEERTLKINVMHVKFSDNGSSFYEVTFIIYDPNPKIEYSVVDALLSSIATSNMSNMIIEKYKIIDIGLVVTSMIVNIAYHSEFKVSSLEKENKISFLIQNHGEKSEAPRRNVKDVNDTKYEVEDKYYNRVTEKVFTSSAIKDNIKKKQSLKNVVTKKSLVKNYEEEDLCNT